MRQLHRSAPAALNVMLDHHERSTPHTNTQQQQEEEEKPREREKTDRETEEEAEKENARKGSEGERRWRFS